MGELLDRVDVPTAYPDEYLDEVTDRMMRLNVAHLVVVSRNDASLVGYLSWRDLLQTRTRLQQEERERIAFYSWGRSRRRQSAGAGRPPP